MWYDSVSASQTMPQNLLVSSFSLTLIQFVEQPYFEQISLLSKKIDLSKVALSKVQIGVFYLKHELTCRFDTHDTSQSNSSSKWLDHHNKWGERCENGKYFMSYARNNIYYSSKIIHTSQRIVTVVIDLLSYLKPLRISQVFLSQK